MLNFQFQTESSLSLLPQQGAHSCAEPGLSLNILVSFIFMRCISYIVVSHCRVEANLAADDYTSLQGCGFFGFCAGAQFEHHSGIALSLGPCSFIYIKTSSTCLYQHQTHFTHHQTFRNPLIRCRKRVASVAKMVPKNQKKKRNKEKKSRQSS